MKFIRNTSFGALLLLELTVMFLVWAISTGSSVLAGAGLPAWALGAAVGGVACMTIVGILTNQPKLAVFPLVMIAVVATAVGSGSTLMDMSGPATQTIGHMPSFNDLVRLLTWCLVILLVVGGLFSCLLLDEHRKKTRRAANIT